jgi:serine/threonine-protein kinase
LYRLGKYQLVARLGTGGMAEVWKARVIGDEPAPPVVIKRVLPGHAHDSSFAKSLRVEAQVLTHLSHPGIVQLHALEEIDGQMLLVLEHVDGCDLRALMSSLGAPPPPGFGAYLAHQVCLALGHAHRFAGSDGRVRAILHRDVSPSNVMLTRDGAV